jgi:DNA polymerase alpha subunit A
MASLLSSVTAEPSRKRKSSPPDYPSSDPAMPSSSSSWSVGRRWGDASDDEVWDPYSGSMQHGKKPRVSEATIKPALSEDENEGVDFGAMDVDMDEDIFVKQEAKEDVDDDDNEMAIKPAARQVRAAGPRRRVNNSSAVKNVPVKPEPEEPQVQVKPEPMDDDETEIKKPLAHRKPTQDRTHWMALQSSLSQPKSDLDVVRAPTGSVKPENVLEADGSLRMFWLDFQEQDGVVHLVGKVLDRNSKKYVSACVSVKGIQRNLFVKPRKKRFSGGRETDMEVSKTDVYQEFDNVRSRHGIEEWAAKFVQRKYAFEDHTVDRGESEWMKVVYPFNQAEMPQNLTGQTFSHVFGTNTSAFELLAIKRRIMGPCWLNITSPQSAKTSPSWCKIEFTVDTPKNVNPFDDTDESAPKDAPPLTMLSIALRTIVNHRENKTEILVATARVWESMNIDDPTPPIDQPSSIHTFVRPIEKFPPGLETKARENSGNNTPFQAVKAERALLNALLATIQRHDPDVIVGFNFLGNHLEALLYRLKELKADQWSRIGRFRRKGFNISKAGNNHRLLAGRLVADLSSDAAKVRIDKDCSKLTAPGHDLIDYLVSH